MGPRHDVGRGVGFEEGPEGGDLLAEDGELEDARARRGEIGQLTGVSDPYEEPLAAEVVVETDGVVLKNVPPDSRDLHVKRRSIHCSR